MPFYLRLGFGKAFFGGGERVERRWEEGVIFVSGLFGNGHWTATAVVLRIATITRKQHYNRMTVVRYLEVHQFQAVEYVE